MRVLALSLVLLFLSGFAVGQDEVPEGTIIPARLNTSLNSRKNKPGETVTARIMHDVVLQNGRIPAGAKLLGHVKAASSYRTGAEARVDLYFDQIEFAHRSLPLNANLRALASLMEVEDAQVPPSGPDRGTPWGWTTRNLIGGEVAYGEGGPVSRGTANLGRALLDGAIMPVAANPSAGCPAEPYDHGTPQAFWVFSSDACGIYGVPRVQIAHRGRTDPTGVFSLRSRSSDFNIRAGSGILLRAN